MKTLVVLAAGIALVSIWFCPMTMAAPPMPNDVQMVEPDPSLPKELKDFWGKWEGSDYRGQNFFLIIEKIDEKNASLYIWRSGTSFRSDPGGWFRKEAEVIKENGKYKLSHPAYSLDPGPKVMTYLEYRLRGKYLDARGPGGSGPRYRRVP
jgi:hypothetical protein